MKTLYLFIRYIKRYIYLHVILKVIFIVDFNTEMTNGYLLEELYPSHSLKTLANETLCFKNHENRMRIYHILTN